jgi:hypothetical protein
MMQGEIPNTGRLEPAQLNVSNSPVCVKRKPALPDSGPAGADQHLPIVRPPSYWIAPQSYRMATPPPPRGARYSAPLNPVFFPDNFIQPLPLGPHSHKREHSPRGREHSPGGWEHSPGGWEHSPDGREHSPGGWEHSPEGREHSPDGWGTSPVAVFFGFSVF